MFCRNKNSFLQLEYAMEPRVINKAVRLAMRKKQSDPHEELPSAQRLSSMQPSVFAPWMDVTRARLGFGRCALRIINRDLNSDDSIIQLQAIHSLLDQVQISENAMFLISLNVIYRLIDLMENNDPIVREKVLIILTCLTSFYQGRKRIMSRPIVIDRLIHIFLRDRKEIRYVAALFLKTLTRDKCCCEIIIRNDNIVESLIKMIKNDHVGIVIFHINSLKNLSEWDPVKPLKANAFQLMKNLMIYHQYRIVQAAMDCMTQLCKHRVGKKLADKHDMTKKLQSFLVSPNIEVIISTVGLMGYTTVTTMAKWRVKEFAHELTNRLVSLCVSQTIPVLQMRAMQVLINLCDCVDIRYHIKRYYERKIQKKVLIRTHEQWDGTSKATTFGLETGHNYRTMCIEDWETIKNDEGDNAYAVNVHSYIGSVQNVKDRLLKAMNVKPYEENK